jgi:hypothetical protein
MFTGKPYIYNANQVLCNFIRLASDEAESCASFKRGI